MDPSDLAILRASYGSAVSWYLKNYNVVPKKTASGAYVISSRGCFDTCLELIFNRAGLEGVRGKKTSVRDREKSSLPIQPEKATNYVSKLFRKRSKNVAEPRVNLQKKSDSTNLTIFFSTKFQKFKAKAPPPPLRFSRLIKRRSMQQFNDKELYEMIMKTDIGIRPMTGYSVCCSELCQILAEFQLRHGKFRYFTNLQNILKNKGCKTYIEALGVTLKQYQQFIYNIFAFVIPKSLFGNCKNARILRKALKEYYLSPYKAPIRLNPYIQKLDISSIWWLKAIKDPNTRWSVIAKVTKWLFESFFVPLLKALFYERKSLYNEKRIMVGAENWKRFKRVYINQQLSKGRIAKVNPDDDCRMTDIPSGTMILYPKSKGVRPIYRLRHNDYQRKEADILRTFLQQQYLQKYDLMKIDGLYSIWLKHITPKENNANSKVNVVTCDVSDAFGSIIRKKLFDIVNGMINEIPDEILPLRWYELILPSRKGRKPAIQYKRWFSCCPATPLVRNRSLVATSTKPEHEILHMKKEYIRAKLEAYIFEQTFVFKGQEYELIEGIVQGSQLSSILSDIYYQHMTVQEFGIFMQSGTMSRYVDDFIYITKNEDSARRFMKAIGKIIPEYNCRFHKSKVQANIRSRICKESEWVDYIGFKLNGNTMQARPDYENLEFQYLKWMRSVARKNSLPMFTSRSMYFGCLKLKRIVLDPKINSLSGLCTTAGLAAKVMATRCLVLVSTIFEDATQYRDGIMKQIRVVVKEMEKMFCQYLTASDRAKWSSFRRSILIAIWQSFFRVFARNPNLRDLFCKDMKRMVQNRAIL